MHATSGETAKTKRVFKDNGNLVLNTGSLTYSDIYDNDTEKNQNLNVGLGTTINFGFSNGGVDIEQTTKATIGNGKITIGGHTLTDNETITQDGTIVAKSEENTGINRDVNNSQEITKNETTGGWNVDVSLNIPELLDLIDKGPEQYTKDQINKAKENINKVKEQINKFKDIVVDVTKSIVDKFKDNGSNVITEDDIRQIIENNKDSIDEMAKQYVNLNETDLTEEQVKAILTKLLLEQGITLALNGSLEGLGITKDYLERGGLIALVQAIETQGGTRFENLNWYATDENGELFKKAVQCTSSTSCYQINNDNSKTKLTCNNGNCTGKDSDGNQINITIKVDKNGKPIKVLSPAYIPSTGKYDAMSLGKIHWAGNKGGQDRGLDYLLQDAKTNYPEFYNDYIKIAGTDENGKPITDTRNMTTSQLKELKTAERIYFTEPVSKLPTEVQDRINNSPLIVQQIIMSTYVQFGSDNKDINKAINNFGNPNMSDKDILEKIFYEKELKGHSNRADLERQALDLFYQLQKGKK